MRCSHRSVRRPSRAGSRRGCRCRSALRPTRSRTRPSRLSRRRAARSHPQAQGSRPATGRPWWRPRGKTKSRVSGSYCSASPTVNLLSKLRLQVTQRRIPPLRTGPKARPVAPRRPYGSRRHGCLPRRGIDRALQVPYHRTAVGQSFRAVLPPRIAAARGPPRDPLEPWRLGSGGPFTLNAGRGPHPVMRARP